MWLNGIQVYFSFISKVSENQIVSFQKKPPGDHAPSILCYCHRQHMLLLGKGKASCRVYAVPESAMSPGPQSPPTYRKPGKCSSASCPESESRIGEYLAGFCYKESWINVRLKA